MIGSEEQIKCGWCGKHSTAKEWQDATLNACYTREQRRAFRKLEHEKYFKHDQKMYYLCPNCRVWQKACNTTLIRTVDGIEKKLGGKPVLKVIDNKAM